MKLIDADSLIEECYKDGAYGYVDALQIAIAPTIEAKPVRHGRWIGAPLWGNDNCRCSECGSWCNIHVNLRGKVIQKYCPYCGAKMTMEEEDG